MIFFRKKETVIRRASHPYNGSFLQPLAVAIVSAVLVAMILIMGYLDVRRSETNLVGFLEDQALATISVLQRLTEENLKSIVATPGKTPAQTQTASQQESDFSKKLVVEAITALGQKIDEQWKKKLISDASLSKFAAENNFWYAAVLNRQGNAIYQSSPLQTDMLDESDLSVGGRRATTLDLLEKIRVKEGIGYVGLRRNDNSGTVIITLDKPGLIYWSMKVAVDRGIHKMGEGHGIVYLQVFDQHKKLLSVMGKLPSGLQEKDFDFNHLAAGKTRIVTRKVDAEGKEILDMAAPFLINKKPAGVVRIGLERGSMDTIIAENRRNIFIFMMLVVFIALLSMWLLYHDQNRHLAGIIDMERRLEKAERLSSLGQLAAGVAHEIRNPLNAISMAAQRLKRDYGPPDEAKAAEFQNLSGVIRDEIRRLNGIIEEFLSFSKSRRLELRDFSVTEVLQKIVSLISEEAQSRGIRLETRWRLNPAVIPMDINKLQQAFLNFIKNAMESIEGQGAITIAVDKEGKNFVVVSITDTGCGMTAEEIEKIFNPEYTTKEKGLGLGIPLAMEIIRGHGGDVRVISRRGAGTTFEVVLPKEKIGEKT
jgi:signal transduction histidine kinase